MSRIVECYLLPASLDPAAVKLRCKEILPDALVQVVGSRAVRNAKVFELIAWQTLSARAAGCLLARTPEMDLLLRLAGTTQISRAIRDSGAKKGEANILIVAGRTAALRKIGVAGLGIRRRLARRTLTGDESMVVERAAMLNATRP
jgi:tRNA threonylcarbamoyladenosine modification (KEOPS) complex Cgi121 subunit